nr:uncharacterized protein LOC111503870 [Leptinotarsa decemlineata]
MGAPADPYADDMREREKMGLDCVEEVNIDRRIIDRAVATEEFPDEPKYKEFLACSYKKQGYQTADGVIQYKNIKDFLSRFYKRSDLKIIDNCKSDNEKSHGDRAFDALLCVIANLHVIEGAQRSET